MLSFNQFLYDLTREQVILLDINLFGELGSTQWLFNKHISLFFINNLYMITLYDYFELRHKNWVIMFMLY